jgi:CheY-like chemotaxis protein
MAPSPAPADAKLDLATANVLIIGDKAGEQDIIAQMLMGFGVVSIHREATAEDGLRAATEQKFDLALIDSGMKGEGGYDFVEGVRRHADAPFKHLPIILICGHLRKPDVLRARDCGASFVVTKPLSPQVLFDRIVWLARDRRVFVECPTYAGPDRRIKSFGPPMGMKGRRSDDLSEHVGEAKEANLSQDAVDDFFSPTKVTL